MSDLPEGWCFAKLTEVLAEGPTNGYSPQSTPTSTGTLTLRLSATTSGRLILNDETTKRIAEEISADSKFWLNSGDLLVQRANTLDYVGTAAVFEGPANTYIYPDLMMRIRPHPTAADPHYMWRLINSHQAKTYFRERATGTAGNMPKINGETLRELPVLLPPISEQRRIVAKIDALTARSRRAKEALDAIPALLERFRQSVLAAAFRGDLTAAWREKNPDVEPAEALLKRIRAERRRRWEEAEFAKLRAKGKVPGDDRWKEKYEEPAPVDPSELPELPEGWCWASLDELLLTLRNGIADKPDQEAGLQILRISAVRPLYVSLDDVRYLKIRPEYDDYILSDGDLLFTRYNGNPEFVGVAALVRGMQGQIVYPDKLIRARCVPGLVHPDFLEVVLNSGASRAHIASKGKTAAGQVGISGSDLRSTPVPISSIDEQHEISLQANKLLRSIVLTTRLSSELAKSCSDIDRGILAKAFRGELVPQDPADEPAQSLLERLRVEATPKATAAPARKTTRKRP